MAERMTEQQSGEEWLETDSAEFLAYGWAFVPHREEQINTMAALVSRADSIVVTDLCAGEGLLSEAILRRHGGARVVAYDGSSKMLAAAAKRLEPFGQRFQALRFDLADRGWRQALTTANYVVSSLAIHHLSNEQKVELFRDVAQRMRPGGRIIVADIVEPETTAGRELAAAAWDDSVKASSLRRYGDLRAWDAFCSLRWNYFSDSNPDPVDRPAPLFAQLGWLADAGFRSVDVHW